MSEILQELGTPAMQEAMDANFAEELVCFGRALPGGEVHEDAELLWFYTGRLYLNIVMHTHLAHNDEEYIDSKIAEVLHYFQERKTAFGWAIRPSTYPPTLTQRLKAHGFKQVHQNIRMALDLFKTNEDIPSPSELLIKEIEDVETLKIYESVAMRGFNASQEQAEVYYDNYVANGFGRGKPWHHYLARLNNEPVAIASLLLHAGIAGIYGVATIPEARRQGIGASVTMHALRDARTLGYRIAMLAPSEMGLGVYRRIGFQEYGMDYYYEWSPS